MYLGFVSGGVNCFQKDAIIAVTLFSKIRADHSIISGTWKFDCLYALEIVIETAFHFSSDGNQSERHSFYSKLQHNERHFGNILRHFGNNLFFLGCTIQLLLAKSFHAK
jgi:hypothetical protein